MAFEPAYDIHAFAKEVLGGLKPYTGDITDRVFLAIEQNPQWLAYYEKLTQRYSLHAVNKGIGWSVCNITRRSPSGRRKARSRLIKSYTILL